MVEEKKMNTVKFEELSPAKQSLCVILFGLLMIAFGILIGWKLGVKVTTGYFEEIIKEKCVWLAQQLF